MRKALPVSPTSPGTPKQINYNRVYLFDPQYSVTWPIDREAITSISLQLCASPLQVPHDAERNRCYHQELVSYDSEFEWRLSAATFTQDILPSSVAPVTIHDWQYWLYAELDISFKDRDSESIWLMSHMLTGRDLLDPSYRQVIVHAITPVTNRLSRAILNPDLSRISLRKYSKDCIRNCGDAELDFQLKGQR
jgi:hypothetical protein